MADKISGFKVSCIGGLNTNGDVLSQGEITPGSAVQLVNYEPSITGGYRRISGYNNSYGTVTGTGSVLGVMVAEGLNDGVFACRKPSAGTNYFYKWVNSSSTWSAVTTPGTVTMTGVKKVRFSKYNWSTTKIALTDGINPAAIYDGTTYTQITHANAPNSPKYSSPFKNHLFLAGDPTDPYNLYFSSPLSETDFNPANGAGIINVGFDIVQIKQFRDTLYIFGKSAIKSLTGTNVADFVLSEVTTNLGCLVPDSVVEFSGNLLFLGPDGFRPISGTNKIGDVELETISRQIQFTISAIISDIVTESIDPETLSTVLIRKKSQFRLMSPVEGTTGLLGGLRQNDNGGLAFEFSSLFNFYVTCAASGYIGIDEVVIHGDSAGKVHRQESGTSFNGTEILSIYQTPYFYFQDPTIRKNFYNITTFLKSEGSSSIVMGISYDFEDSVNVFNPKNNIISTAAAAAYYNVSLYNSAAIYDGNPSPVAKTNIEGSGFSISFRYVTNDTNASHTIQGLVLNYSMNDRR
jgi:hypothetical protein